MRRDVTDRRRAPGDGVLDSLFAPRWVVRHRLDPDALRAEIALRGSEPFDARHALSDHWRERVWALRLEGRCGAVVSPGAYPQQTYPERIEPAVRDFILGEWSPDWMPHFFDWRQIDSPAACPFGQVEFRSEIV